MGDFDTAFLKTMKAEGGYDNIPEDRGGETFRGIARKFNGAWPGWALVDKLKPDEKAMLASPILESMVKDFYRAEYWNKFALDEIPHQRVAEELFDTAVNMGVLRAGIFLQTGLNCLNNQGKRWTNIGLDGKCGPATKNCLLSCLGAGLGDVLFKVLNVLQGNQYLQIMQKDETQEVFALGWFQRVNLS